MVHARTDWTLFENYTSRLIAFHVNKLLNENTKCHTSAASASYAKSAKATRQLAVTSPSNILHGIQSPGTQTMTNKITFRLRCRIPELLRWFSVPGLRTSSDYSVKFAPAGDKPSHGSLNAGVSRLHVTWWPHDLCFRPRPHRGLLKPPCVGDRLTTVI